MKRNLLILGLGLLMVSGCQTPNQANGAVGGGVIGGLARNPAAGLAIGAGTGALVGSAVGAEKDRKEAKQAQAAAQAYAAANPKLSLADIVQMTNLGTSDAVIINQMATTGSYYNLTPADIEYLQQSGVHQAVVLEMQRRRTPPPVVYAPPPRPVYVVEPGPPPPPAVGVGVIYAR